MDILTSNPHLLFKLCSAKQKQSLVEEIRTPEKPKLPPSKLESFFLPAHTSEIEPADFLKFELMFLITLGLGPLAAFIAESRRLQKSKEIAQVIAQMEISDTNDKNDLDELYHLSVADVVFVSILFSWAWESLHHDQKKVIDSVSSTADTLLSPLDGTRSLVAIKGSIFVKDKNKNQLAQLFSFGQYVSLCRIPLTELDPPAFHIVREEQKKHAQEDAAQLFAGIATGVVLAEFTAMFLIYSDFKFMLGDTNVFQDKALLLEQCTEYLENNPEQLDILETIFNENGNEKLEQYCDICYLNSQAMHAQDPVRAIQLSSFYSAMCNLYEVSCQNRLLIQ